MWDSFLSRLREWYILIGAAVVILGGLYLASWSRDGETVPVAAQPTAFASQPVASPTPAKSRVAEGPAAAASSAEAAAPAAPATPPAAQSAGAAPAAGGATPAKALVAAAPSAEAAAPPAPAAPPAAQSAGPAPATAGAAPGGMAGMAMGDPQAGRQVFKKCQACHSLAPGKNMLGPSLAGVIGRKAGTEEGYTYSEAMKNADIVWSAATLDSYLTAPQKLVPGNKMPFPGLKTDHDRADVIAYLAAGGGAPAQAPAACGRLGPGRGRLRRKLRRPRPRRRRPMLPAARRPPGHRISAGPMPATPNIRCVPGSPRGGWCSLASAAKSTAR